MAPQPFKSFAEFWPHYAAEHSKTLTRLLHAFGTTAGLVLIAVVIAIGKWWLFPAALAPGYGLAWIGHFFVEKNRPATFEHPLWSFMGDWKMLALMLAGRMGEEVKRATGQTDR
jgi:hypothetical protein